MNSLTRTVAPAQKLWASTTSSKQQLNPSLTQVPGLQEQAREEVRPGVRKHARELLDRDKKKDELDLGFQVKQPDLQSPVNGRTLPHERKSRVIPRLLFPFLWILDSHESKRKRKP